VAASMDKRRQARNFEREQIEQRDRLSAQPPPWSRANGHENNSAATDSEELATAKPSPLRLRKPSAEQLSTTGFRSRLASIAINKNSFWVKRWCGHCRSSLQGRAQKLCLGNC